MKKFVVCALLLALMAAVACPAMAWDAAKQKTLGEDSNKMTWYLLDYGTDKDGKPYAISRKYYTNTNIKNDTIELLMSKFNLSPEVAGSLYFTEYGYEYTPDGNQYAMTYLRHYDMLGNLIHGTEYDDSSEDTKKTYASVAATGSRHAVYQGAAYALGKSPAASTTTKKTTTKKSTVPAKRVVRSKRK